MTDKNIDFQQTSLGASISGNVVAGTAGDAEAVRASARVSRAPTVPHGAGLDGAGDLASGAGQGGGSGITHLANRQTEGEPGRELGGEDTVHLALNVFWRDDFEGLLAALEVAQADAQRLRGLGELDRNGQRFAVRRAGVKTGQGRGRYFRFVLNHLGTGTVVKMTDEPQAPGDTPNVFIELGSAFLMRQGGIVGAWAETRNLLEALGGYVLWDKVSRVDMCADFPGWDMAPFRSLIMDESQVVTRARSRNLYVVHESTTGISLGTGSIKLRIYDKAREVQVKQSDAVKRQILEQLRWNGPQTSAVRVEYQLRREVLRTITIEGVGAYLRLRQQLAHYLCHDWFRIADEKPDRENNNTQRAGVHPMWAEVQGAFAQWTGGDAPSIHRGRVKTAKDPVRLVKQAKGCLLAALADLGEASPASLEELIAKASECLTWDFERSGEVESLRRFDQKRLERGSRGG